jgi:shikimate kinase
MLIFLVGFMGSGKSTVGKKLASQLKYKFIDLDDTIASINGLSVVEIFNIKGEAHFRKLESEVLRSISTAENTVIATGGGTPCFNDNMKWLTENGITVFLKAHPATIFHRVAPSKAKRPLISGLNDVDLMDFITNEYKNRLPFYNQASLIVKAENIKVDELTTSISALINDER